MFQVSRNSVLAEPGETKAPERVRAALGLSQLCKDRMQRAPQDVRLAERSACLGTKQQAGLPLAKVFPEHCSFRRMRINFPLTVGGLQVIVYFTPPRLLADFDCGAVRVGTRS